MDWNTFNRELQNRVNDPNLRFILGLIYERLLDMGKHVDSIANVLLELVGTIQNVVGLSSVMDDRMKQLYRQVNGRDDGISVESVPITNDDV